MQKRTSDISRQFAKARSLPSFNLIVVEAELHVETNEDGVAEKKIEWIPVKTTPLMKGIDLLTAKRCCDMVQKEYDQEGKPVRVYLYASKDPCPIYAGLSAFCKICKQKE